MQKILDEKRRKKKPEVVFSEDKIREMHDLAQKISKNLSGNNQKRENKKSVIQLEIEVDKSERLNEREYLKTLTPSELLVYNRNRLEKNNDDSINEIDDCKTDITFSKALEISEKTAKLHTELQLKKDVLDNLNEINTEKMGNFVDNKKGKSKKKIVVDVSGKIDGEKINGLLKTEMKKSKRSKHKTRNDPCESQDEYVLNKLFSKKGLLILIYLYNQFEMLF